MLEALCGNKNVQNILIFLFVNGKCYGTQLHRSLKTSLTPIQKALSRLEKGGLILSYYEGKTRLYQLNPAYPLLEELEHLLKKAYTLLPSHRKKDFYVPKLELSSISQQENPMQVLLTFWEKLRDVKQLSFNAKSQSKEDLGWAGRGKGEVMISKESNHVLIYHEKGMWINKEKEQISFTNVFRWTLDRTVGVISLEHLRRGMDHPVFLFHLAPSNAHSLSSVDSHLCEGDTYFGQIYLDSTSLRLNWRVIGPKKNEEIDYYYT